ncbi:serine hydrolase domain-containing protein [Micromonospora pisi]|uniref:serine hydrolase domain-containing protein n=1 Tax=Micromonospora pisi TaxID=589240 RepID=UPI001FE2E5E8|nr:serine hydrolase domain-containing protein [Micromonospora pisi]
MSADRVREDRVVGDWDRRFVAVRDAFAALLGDERPPDPRPLPGTTDELPGGATAGTGAVAETGASLAVWHRGRPVLDLYGGWRDSARTREWSPDTLVNVYSVGKPVAALCVLLLVEQGRIGLDDPVARHWPGFRAEATVRHVLSHTAGLPVFPVPRPERDLDNWALLTGDLAAAEPLWAPGTVAAEHALTYGHLLGELVRRVDGRTIGRFLADEIAGPWRLDLHFGLAPIDQARCADLGYGDPDWPVTILGTPGSLRARALGNPAGCLDLAVLNGARWRGAEVPAVNLHATAAGLARLYAGLLAGGELDGVRLFGADLVAEATRAQFTGADLLLERPVRWTLGMQVEEDGSWGMGGIGGSAAWADPVRDYTFAYATRHLAGFDRVEHLVDVLHTCLDG